MTVYLQYGADGSVYMVESILDDAGLNSLTPWPSYATQGVVAQEPVVIQPQVAQPTGVVDSAKYHAQNFVFVVVGLAIGALLTEKIMTMSEAAGGFSRIAFP